MPSSSLRLIVMGVSGCGKSTLAAALAQRLGLQMVDGDDLHTAESVAKMRSGVPLHDDDRWPWLDRVGDYLAQADSTQGRVVACSALRRAYRERIRSRAGEVCFVFLQGDFALIERRMAQRVGHYMQPELLASQFRTLEVPQADETDVITLPITDPVEHLVAQALAAVQTHQAQHAAH